MALVTPKEPIILLHYWHRFLTCTWRFQSESKLGKLYIFDLGPLLGVVVSENYDAS